MALPSWIQIGIPSLDHPFGLHLWPVFEHIFTAVKGYAPQDWRFKQGETPMSTYAATATVLVSYYILIFGGREIMKSREAFRLNWLFKIHNFYLTAISAILLALFVEQLLSTVVRKGIFYAICAHGGGWTDELVILYYVSCPNREMGSVGRVTNGVCSSTTSPSTLNSSIPSSSSSGRSH
jgi:fatty acid elongase 3